MGTQATADTTTTTASEAVEMPECEAPAKKKKSSAKKNTQQEDVEVLAPSIQPATKTAKRFAKLDQSKIEEKLSVTQSRLESAKTKFVRLKREELALHAAIRIKTQGPDCEDATKQAKRASASAKKVSSLFVLFFACLDICNSTDPYWVKNRVAAARNARLQRRTTTRRPPSRPRRPGRPRRKKRRRQRRRTTATRRMRLRKRPQRANPRPATSKSDVGAKHWRHCVYKLW